MALIPIYHVVAASRQVDVSAGDIKMGMIVSLNSDGEVVKQDVTNAFPYGIAGDTKANDASSMPGVTGSWQNRASDYFDETKASGKMTVYHSGGQFYTDQYVTAAIGTTVGVLLYSADGLLRNTDTQTSGIVARLLAAPGMVMSGVPGTDISGDIAMGSEAGVNDNQYIEIKLLV